MAQHAKTADAQEHVVLALPTTRGRVVVIEMPKGMIAMQCSSETVPCPSATAIEVEVEVRDRDFTRAVPQLRRFAARLLSTVFEVEAALAQAREAWLRTEGAFDAPIRHLLRIVAETCIERQREITRAMPGPTDEERAFLAIADAAEVSLLIAVNRLPRRAQGIRRFSSWPIRRTGCGASGNSRMRPAPKRGYPPQQRWLAINLTPAVLQ